MLSFNFRFALQALRTADWPWHRRLLERRPPYSRRNLLGIQSPDSPAGPDYGLLPSNISPDLVNKNEAEEALRGSNEFIETLFDSVSDGICVIDPPTFRIVKANRAFLETLGLDEAEVIGRPCYEITHGLPGPCKAPLETCPLTETVRTGAVSKAEHVHHDKNGRKVYVEVSTAPLAHKYGTVSQVIHTSHDITERKLKEEQAQCHVQRLSALRSIDMLITSSLDLRVTLNVLIEQVLSQLGVDAADVLLFNTQTQRLEYATGRGFHTRALQHTSLKPGQGHAGKAALLRRAVNIPDLAADPRELALAPLLANERFVAYYAAPLVSKGQVKGVLEIFHRSPLAPHPEWTDFLELLAGQAAIAIDNATLFEDLQRSNLELSVAYDATLEGWAAALDLRHKETEGHTRRVTEITVRLARACGLRDCELASVRRGALLHDIGKLGIPDSILNKPGPLSEEEWSIMRQHPVYARQFLARIDFLHSALDIPYSHHEKWNGSGYPLGLQGHSIPLAARIFAVVDVWDALRSDRAYRAAWPEDRVRGYIKGLEGAQFDPHVVGVFLELLNKLDLLPALV